MSTDESEKRVQSGEAWAEFCEAIKAAGSLILSDSAPTDAIDRAEGFRYLTRLLRMGFESQLEFSDPSAPVLYRNVHETAKLGADNPDNYYQTATVSGKHEYLLSGSPGTIHYLGFGTYSPGLDGRETHGYLERQDLALEPDGGLKIHLACEPRPGNWLRMQPNTRTLLIRQTFLDRENEEPAALRIERVGGDQPTPITARRLDRALRTTAGFVGGYAKMFVEWAEDMRERPNQLPEFDPAKAAASGGDPNIRYYNGYWELADDEALVITVTPPACDYWNFQLSNWWMESLDYRYFDVHLNKHTARLRDDGSVRIVIAHEDPGVENWLQTTGHRAGTMTLRWVGATEYPAPSTQVVKLSDLG